MYLLDTNILIYYLQGNEKLIEYLNDLCEESFAISIISRLELLLGYKKEKKTINEMESVIDECRNIPLDQKVVKEAFNLHRDLEMKLKFKDLVIAATAKAHGYILLTSDKDFNKLSGIKVELFKV